MNDVIFALVALALLAAWLYRERENAKERAALADRIMVPGAFQASVLDRMEPISFGSESETEIYTDPVLPDRHNDLALQALLGEDQ